MDIPKFVVESLSFVLGERFILCCGFALNTSGLSPSPECFDSEIEFLSFRSTLPLSERLSKWGEGELRF